MRTRAGSTAWFLALATILWAYGAGSAHAAWEWQNPRPTSNFLHSADFIDSNNGWTVGSGGTILRTIDGGATWVPQASGTTRELRSVVFTDVNNGWASGDWGVVLHTTDGGAHWSPQNSGTTTMLCSITFIDQNHGWAAGGYDTIVRTTNGGQTWTLQTSWTNTAPPPKYMNSVAFADANSGWAVEMSAGFIHTTDGGATWTPTSSGAVSLFSITFVDASHGWAVGSSGTVMHTVNGGALWTTQTTNPSAGTLRSVHFTDANNGWAVGNSGAILHTTNGGTTWTSQTSGTTNQLDCVTATDASHVWAVGYFGTVMRSTNGGATWTPMTTGTTASLRSSDFVNASTGWVAGDGGAILHTDNGGTSWVSQTSGTTARLNSVSFASANSGWVVGDAGKILHSANGGSTWASQTSGTTAALRSVSFVDSTKGWVVGDGGKILRTANGGAAWASQVSGTSSNLNGVAFVDANSGWAVGSGGTILHTANGGSTWVPQNSGTANTLQAVTFIDANNGWCVGLRGDAEWWATILHTSNGGATWTKQTSLVMQVDMTWLDFMSVSFTDANNGWIAGWFGEVAHTTDGGATWTRVVAGTDQGLSAVTARDGDSCWVAGNGGAIIRVSVPADLTLPSTTLQRTPAANASGWNRTSVTVTLDATDVSGVAATYYTLDGVQHPYTTAFTVSAEGTHTLSYWSVDNSDNEEVPRKTASVWIDTAPPSTTCNVGGSYVGSATIGFAAGDGLGSGLDTIHWVLTGPEGKSGIGPVASVATAGTYTLQYWSVDKAGNEELPHKSAVFIVFPSPDTTAPHTVSNRVALYANSATIRLTSTDNPDGSGVAHTFYTLQGGSQIESSTVRVVAPGTYLMAFWSVDASGNIEPTQTVSFSVITSPSNKGTPSKPSVPSPVRHGRSFAASGYVIRHRSGTYPVVLQFYRYEHGHWRLRKSITARASNMLTFSKYSRSTTVPYAGKWRVRARHKVGTKYRYSSYRCFVAN